MRGYDLTSEPQPLEALQNAFILIYRCEIYPYVHILFKWKKKVEATVFFHLKTVASRMFAFHANKIYTYG